MPLVFAIALLFATPIAYAMGSPSVLYLMGGELLALVAGAVWVATAAKPWTAKWRAMASVFVGLVVVVVLHAVPDYLARQTLIEGASVICLVLAIATAILIVRRD
jgi:hypothetical protein